MFKQMLLSLTALLAVFAVACGGSSNAANTTLSNAQEVKKPEGEKAGAELKFSQDGSSIEWTGRKFKVSKHDGGFSTFSGTLTLDKEGKGVTYASVDIDMASVWADDKAKPTEKLVGHLKTDDFFGVEKFPKGKFETTKIESNNGKTEVTGNLTLRGVSKALTFPAEITVAEKDVSIKAELKFDRQPFGIAFKGAEDNVVQDDVEVRLNILAKR